LSETVLSKSDLQKLDETIFRYISTKMVPSLSTLLNEDIKFESIKTSELSFENMTELIPSEINSQDVGVYVTCDGEIKFGILFHLKLSDAKKLASKLLCSEQTGDLTTDGKSAVSEIGNILAASFFNTVNEETGMQMMSSVPGLAIDSATTLIETPIMETALSNTFIHSFGQLHCVDSKVTIHASIFQDPDDARKFV
jgi:chemotaxis protein CheC